jgi:hypothetical protein
MEKTEAREAARAIKGYIGDIIRFYGFDGIKYYDLHPPGFPLDTAQDEARKTQGRWRGWRQGDCLNNLETFTAGTNSHSRCQISITRHSGPRILLSVILLA